MKTKIKTIVTIITLITTLCFTSLLGCGDGGLQKDYVELGIPLKERFLTGEHARCPWDVCVFNGEVFVGSGDYTLYSGPTSVFSYDLEEKKWENKGSVRDAQVGRFLVIDETLILPGIDPMGDWGYGSYYKYDGNKFESFNVLPNGIHNFDIVKFNDMIFAGLGVLPENPSVAVSKDDFLSFELVPFKKDGANYDTTAYIQVRTYDFIVLNDELYALLYLWGENVERKIEIFKFENDEFNYFADYSSLPLTNRVTDNILSAKVEFNDSVYFVTDYLYLTEDITNFSKVTLPEDEFVSDLLIDGEKMYILCYKKTGEKYAVNIYALNESGLISKVKGFRYDVMPICFDKNGNDFFVGMGDKNNVHDANGMILQVKA